MSRRRRKPPKGKARTRTLAGRAMRRKRAGSDALRDSIRDGRRLYGVGLAK